MTTRTIGVSIPHRLGSEQAKARLQDASEKLRSQFRGQVAQVHEAWNGNHADFKFSAMGQSITGRIDVEESVIRLAIDLPWVLGMLAGKVRSRVEQEARKYLAKR